MRLGIELAQLLEVQADLAGAVTTLDGVIDLDATCEEAHIAVMRLYASQGNLQRALRRYRHLCDALRRDLTVEPAPAAVQLYGALLAEAGLFGRPPGAPSTPTRPRLGSRHHRFARH